MFTILQRHGKQYFHQLGQTLIAELFRGEKRVQTIWERSGKLFPGHENSKPGFVDLKPSLLLLFLLTMEM